MEKEGRGWNTFVVISLTHEAHTLVARWTAWRDYVKIDRQTIKESRWSVDGTHVFRMSDGSRILAAQITLKEKESRYTVSRLVVDEKEIPLTYSGA